MRATQSPRRRECSRSRPRLRTTERTSSRRLQSESLSCGSDGIHKIRRGRKLLAIRLPALCMNARLLLESLALEQIKPPIGSRVDEELEIRIECELIVGRVYGELHSAIASEQNLETGQGLAHVGQRDRLPLPRPSAA